MAASISTGDGLPLPARGHVKAARAPENHLNSKERPAALNQMQGAEQSQLDSSFCGCIAARTANE